MADPPPSVRSRALQEAPIGVVITDPDREDNPIVDVNRAFLELTGYDREEVLGRNCRFLQGPATAEAPVREMRRAIDADRPVQVDLRNYRADGELFWSRVSIAPVRDESGTVTNYVGTQREVTGEKQRARDLERQNERLDGFASVVSHDLKNPLNVAMGRLELAREGRDDDHLAAVDRALGRMESLIDDVLTLARQGDRATDTRPVDLAAAVEDCWETVETADATLEVDADRTVLADRSRLQQLLENLIRNAVEHGSTSPDSQARQDSVEHGSTSSRAGPDDAVEHGGADVTVRVGELDDGGFYVSDDGPGIPPDEREHVFEAGYSTRTEGTGFGLNIVRETVEAHGWSVRLTEGDAGGARFEFRGVESTT
jgi:PAS domain S-box-containing protein